MFSFHHPVVCYCIIHTYVHSNVLGYRHCCNDTFTE
jgi:hypothetical protein